ncbi:MAG TPA: RNA-binding S4 domain-containing protein [Syntrophomonadaceae bacterium]|nr:RNA-binding S4 domain-containing protein [Syntrophomonadaceae bacterium]
MRLDKYLKVSRIIKRRTVAKEFADNDRVMVNGRVARASTEIKKGDVITVQAGNKKSVYEVLDIVDNIKATDAANLYRIIE